MKKHSWRRELEKKRRGGPDELPLGTLLFYGPDNRRASKVVAAVFLERHGEPLMRKWTWDGELDVRTDPRIGREVTRFFAENRVRRVVTTQGLAGCPHEEGIDYPDGEACPQCPFWADRDRWEEAVKPPVPPGPMAN
ncbi:MAG: hypothetical protein ACJ8J0_07395 [Longimicrobiaceae bacterium]